MGGDRDLTTLRASCWLRNRLRFRVGGHSGCPRSEHNDRDPGTAQQIVGTAQQTVGTAQQGVQAALTQAKAVTGGVVAAAQGSTATAV